MTLKTLAHNCQMVCQHSIGQQTHGQISWVGKHAWSMLVGRTAESCGEGGGGVTPLQWSEAWENLKTSLLGTC